MDSYDEPNRLPRCHSDRKLEMSREGTLRKSLHIARMLRRSDRSLAVASAIAVSAVCGFVYWFGNGSLYLSHWNAQLAASLREAQFRAGWLKPGVFWSPLEGLGQRTLESPSWLNLSYSHMLLTGGRFSETLFGLSIGLSIYVTTYLLARRLSITAPWAVLSGVVSVFVLFLPSPFLWQRQSGQSGSLIMLPIAVALSVALLINVGRSHVVRRLNLGFFGLSVFLFTYSFGPGSLLFLLPVLAIGIPLIFGQIVAGKLSLRWALLQCAVFVVAVLLQVSAQYAFINLHRQSAQLPPGLATFSQDWSDTLRAFWGDLAAVFAWYRWIVILGVIVLLVTGVLIKGSRLLSAIGASAIGFPFLVHLVSALAIRQGRGEILPSSNYFLISTSPVLIAGVVGISSHVAGLSLARRLADTTSVRLNLTRFVRVVRLVPVTTLLAWVTIWSIDNRHLRVNAVTLSSERNSSRELVAPILADLNCTMRTFIDAPQPQPFCGRVLLIDSEQQTNPAIARRDPLWVASLYEPLSLHGVPVVNSYGSRYSGPFYQFTNRAFTDGSQSIRAWVVYNRFDESVARLFGVRVVISDRLLPELDSPREFEIVDGNGKRVRLYQYRLRNPNFNGLFVSELRQAENLSQIVEGLRDASGQELSAFAVDGEPGAGSALGEPESFEMTVNVSEVFVRGVTQSESVVLLPFEYSSCLRLENRETSDAKLLRLNGIQLGIWFTGSLDGIIRLVDRGIGGRSCWNRDRLSAEFLK